LRTILSRYAEINMNDNRSTTLEFSKYIELLFFYHEYSVLAVDLVDLTLEVIVSYFEYLCLFKSIFSSSVGLK
jgi:hypothetical protein